MYSNNSIFFMYIQQQQPSQNIYIDQNQQSGVWMPQRLTLHQQQNPMLNAQLQVKYVFNLFLCILYISFTRMLYSFI